MNRRSHELLSRFAAEARRSRRRSGRRFSLAPLTLGLALGVGLLWLAELVPRVWSATLPGGLRQAATFRGWPGLLWSSVLVARQNFAVIGVGIAVVAVLGLPMASRSALFRWAFRLLALLAVLLDAGLVAATMRVAMAASGLG